MAESKGLVHLLREAFSGFNPADQHNHGLALTRTSGTMITHHEAVPLAAEKGKGGTAVADGWMAPRKLPIERQAKLLELQDMSSDPLLSAGIDMHVAHALSVNPESGRIMTIEAVSDAPEYIELARELNNHLGPMLNAGAPSWAKLCAIFGTHYVRPYADKAGVQDIESSWYTLPTHVTEHVRGGLLAGYTSEHLIERQDGNIKLAPPWSLVAVKIPYWQPNIRLEPSNHTGVKYSLYDDVYHRTPTETQDYGTSFLEFTYSSWCDLTDSIKSLRASRYNASQINRMIGLSMEGLDPVQAAQQLNLVGTQLRSDIEAARNRGMKQGAMPSVWNMLIPNLGGKGGMTVDTQVISPDIQHIEDIMFHLKRTASGLGIDVSMLGWGDLLSGGLGEGGFFRSSIQAAIRSNWLRTAVKAAGNRLIDIHMAHKYGKVFASGAPRPIDIKFHSLNSALELEQAEAMERRAAYATSLATLLDVIEQGSLAKSDTFKNLVLTDIIRMDESKADAILKELAKGAANKADDDFMESVGFKGDKAGFEAFVRSEINQGIINLLGDSQP